MHTKAVKKAFFFLSDFTWNRIIFWSFSKFYNFHFPWVWLCFHIVTRTTTRIKLIQTFQFLIEILNFEIVRIIPVKLSFSWLIWEIVWQHTKNKLKIISNIKYEGGKWLPKWLESLGFLTRKLTKIICKI